VKTLSFGRVHLGVSTQLMLGVAWFDSSLELSVGPFFVLVLFWKIKSDGAHGAVETAGPR